MAKVSTTNLKSKIKIKTSDFQELIEFKRAFAPLFSTNVLESGLKAETFEPFFAKVNLWHRTRGNLETIRFLKEIRVALYNFVAGRKVPSKGPSLTRTNLPKAFGPEVNKVLLERNPQTIRVVLTALMISRVIPGWKDPDITTITEGPKYSKEIREDFEHYMSFVIPKMIPKIDRPEWVCPHFTTKNSPQGIAMKVLGAELRDVQKDPKLMESMWIVAGPTLQLYMQKLIDQPKRLMNQEDPKPSRKGRLRSLGVVKDTEGKSRIIAMGDYWTQTSLKPLHNLLLKQLKTMESDLTFGQDIGPFGRKSQTYYSFDLTAATDRLPIFLYEKILEVVYDKGFQEAWSYLMVGQEFHWKDSTIKYSTGQPMGLYSSWALLALAHHAIVQYSALKLGFKEFKDYRILGDDIVIRNDLVAHRYAETLKSLGVELSPQKSLVSKDTFEFAKRLFYKDVEVTGFPLSGWISATKNGWTDQLNIVETAIRRGYSPSQLVNIDHLVELQKFTGKSQQLRWKLARNMITHIAVTRPEAELLKTAGRLWSLPISCVTSSSLFRREVLLGYSNLLNDQFMKTLSESIKHVKNELKNLSNPIVDRNLQQTMISAFISWLPDEVPTHVNFEYKIFDPYIQCLCASIHSNSNEMDKLADSYSFMGVFRSLESYSSYLSQIDFRVPNIHVRDSSRRSERVFKVAASLSVRSMQQLKLPRPNTT